MKSNFVENIEKKYKIQVLEQFKDKYDEEFIKCKDLEDNENFTIQVRPGEYLEMTLKRVYGFR